MYILFIHDKEDVMSAQEQEPDFYKKHNDKDIILEPWMVDDINKAIQEADTGKMLTLEELESEINSWD